ncbi:MAG: biliverdin-producing heme oxygenase [Oscillochloris sp.]|nr:biliverdin-producing heme oxygenase [Oscillochloris sp.]
MERLKAETRIHHNRLENEPLSRGLTAADVDRARYARVLAVYYGVYAPLEAQLESTVDWRQLGFDLAPRLKTPLLVRDLALMGIGADQLSALPQCSRLPQISDLGAAIGCMYVLEGSTLGGQLITRHIGPALHLNADNGLAFFNSYGPDVGPMWKAFKQFAETHAAGREEAIITAAGATFEALEHWLGAGALLFDRDYVPNAALTAIVKNSGSNAVSGPLSRNSASAN